MSLTSRTHSDTPSQSEVWKTSHLPSLKATRHSTVHLEQNPASPAFLCQSPPDSRSLGHAPFHHSDLLSLASNAKFIPTSGPVHWLSLYLKCPFSYHRWAGSLSITPPCFYFPLGELQVKSVTDSPVSAVFQTTPGQVIQGQFSEKEAFMSASSAVLPLVALRCSGGWELLLSKVTVE